MRRPFARLYGRWKQWKQQRLFKQCYYFYDEHWVYLRTLEKDVVVRLDGSRFKVHARGRWYDSLDELARHHGMPFPEDGSLRIKNAD